MIFLIVFLAIFLFFLQRYIYSKYWKRGINISLVSLDKRIEEGESVFVEERVENNKILPLVVVSIKYAISHSFSPYIVDEKEVVISSRFALLGRKKIIRKYSLPSLKRGIYTFNGGIIESSDLFSSLSFSMPFYSDEAIIVTPRRLASPSFSLLYKEVLGTVLSKQKRVEDPFEIRGIREYQVSDNIKDINWKASAKTGELKVNQRGYTTDEGVCFILDLREGEEDEKEALISLTSTLSFLFLKRGIKVSFITNARSSLNGEAISSGKGSGIAHLSTIDILLSYIKTSSNSNQDISTMLEKERDSNSFVLLTTTAPLSVDKRISSIITLEEGKTRIEGVKIISVEEEIWKK